MDTAAAVAVGGAVADGGVSVGDAVDCYLLLMVLMVVMVLRMVVLSLSHGCQ